LSFYENFCERLQLFELGIWDTFLEKCEVTIARTVAEKEVVFAGDGDNKE